MLQNFCPCNCDVCLHNGGSTSCAGSCTGCSSDCLSCVNGGGGSDCASKCGGSNCVPPAVVATPVTVPDPTPSSSGPCTVIGAATVRLRATPCTTSACTTLRLLSRGDSVQSTGIEQQDDIGRVWTRVSSPQSGWVATQYLTCRGHGARVDGGDSTNGPQPSSGHNAGLIAGVVILGVLAACAVIVAGVLIFSKSTKNVESERP